MKKIFTFMMVLLAVVVLFTQCKKEEPVETTSISGQITNSQTGTELANALLSFYEPGSTTNPVFTTTTNSTGQYSTTSAVVGTYTLTITAANFFTLSLDNFVIASGTVPGTPTELPPITLVQTLSNSLLRIVLTWGQTPSDLDSHFTGPIAGSSTRFHVYYSNDAYNPTNATTPIIKLDVDDVSSYGPETTTINSWVTGTYRYSVHNYTNDDASGAAEIKSSPASVKVYGPAGLLKTYTPPTATATSGNTWVVFEITAAANGTYTITDKNTWAMFADEGLITKK